MKRCSSMTVSLLSEQGKGSTPHHDCKVEAQFIPRNRTNPRESTITNSDFFLIVLL